jgi:hydrogenase nickel incorporation protein HypA/HybF
MHELAIAQSVIDIAARHAGDARVAKVELRVGRLRQVVPSTLEFAFALASPETPVEGAVLELHEVEAAGLCRDCGMETPLPDFPLTCRRCGGFDIEVIRGEELVVDALELEQTPLREAVTTNGR